MPLTVTSRREDGFVILSLKGSLTLGPLLSSIREAARAAMARGDLSGLILDVGGVTLTDSSGIGELTVVYSLALKHHCPLRLVGVSSSLQRMLQMTRIDELLPSAPSLTAAKAAMKSTPSSRANAR